MGQPTAAQSRVVYQSPNERNFHVFYQVVRSDDSVIRMSRSRAQERGGGRGGGGRWRRCLTWVPPCLGHQGVGSPGELGITAKPEDYRYTSQSKCVDVPGVNDRTDFKECKVRVLRARCVPRRRCSIVANAQFSPAARTPVFLPRQAAMKVIGFTQADIDGIYQIVSGILHVGNINFAVDEKDNAYVTNEAGNALFRSSARALAPVSPLPLMLNDRFSPRRAARSRFPCGRPLLPRQTSPRRPNAFRAPPRRSGRR